MLCKGFCSSRKNQLIEDSEWFALALEIFFRSHRLLKNFVDFFKSRSANCCGVNYDKVPLHGALDVVATAMTTIISGNFSKKESQRPTLFRDMHDCTRCQEIQDCPEDVVHKVDILLTCLQKSCAIENIVRQVKDILFTLERLPSCAMSERLRLLSFLLKELMKKFICFGKLLRESLENTQTKLVLNLVNNYIGDWNEKRSQTPPYLKICRFCDRVICETTQQWGTFCCKEAQQFNNIWKEWALQKSTSNADRDEWLDEELKLQSFDSERFANVGEDYAKSYEADGKRSGVRSFREESWTRRVTDYDSIDARSGDENAGRIHGARGEPGDFDRTIKHRSAREIRATRRTEPGVPSKETEPERYDAPNRVPDKFDRVGDKDLTETRDLALERDAGREIKRGRNIDGNSEYPITLAGREKRDDAPYERKSKKIRGRRDADEGGVAVGKTRKAKRGTKPSGRDRSSKSRYSETESEGGRIGTRGGKKLYRSRSKKNRDTESTEDDGPRLDRSRDKSRRGRSETGPRGKKNLYRNTLEENEKEKSGGKTYDTDDEVKTTGQRGGKKARKERDTELAQMTDASRGKEIRGRRKKKMDTLDSEKKSLSYGVDEERKVRKGDGRRKARSSGDRGGTDSELTKKRKGAKARGTSAKDKSTLDWEEESGKRETSPASKKGPRLLDSSKTDGDYSKISGSRYRKRKPRASTLRDVEIDHRRSIEYQLSNQHFVKLGWTTLPIAKTMRKIVQYQARPAKPHLDWFKKYKYNGRIYYDDQCTVFLNFRIDGSGEVFYPNGKLAIEVHRPENREYDMYTVFSPGGKDCMGVERASQIVALFDTTGNGAVFDEDGALRLSYNQIGGISRDNPTGLPLPWKWDTDEKKSIIKTVYVEKSVEHLEKILRPPTKTRSSGSSKAPISSTSSRNKEKKVMEQKPVNAVLEEEGVESGYDFHKNHPKDSRGLQVICLKLNDYISLRILNRRNINLQFVAGRKSIRIELGTILNLDKEIASHSINSSSMNIILKSRFEDLQSPHLKPDSSLYNFEQELREIRKSAGQRSRMIAKYRPYLRAWQKTRTRCHP